MNADDFVGGHSILALERFMDETRHMIIFDVLSWKSPVGEKGERLRLFLSDVGYAKAQASERRGEIKIHKHAAVIEGHIEALTHDKTIIMIAHRLKTVRNADQILVLDNAHIVQRGTHAELIQQKGLYADFVSARQEAIGWKLAQ